MIQTPSQIQYEIIFIFNSPTLSASSARTSLLQLKRQPLKRHQSHNKLQLPAPAEELLTKPATPGRPGFRYYQLNSPALNRMPTRGCCQVPPGSVSGCCACGCSPPAPLNARTSSSSFFTHSLHVAATGVTISPSRAAAPALQPRIH